jgi:hypothetical protein
MASNNLSRASNDGGILKDGHVGVKFIVPNTQPFLFLHYE